MAEWPYGRFHACNYSWWLCLSSSHLADKHEHTAPDKLSLFFFLNLAGKRCHSHTNPLNCCLFRKSTQREDDFETYVVERGKKVDVVAENRHTHTSTRNINLEANRQSQTDDLLNLQEKNW